MKYLAIRNETTRARNTKLVERLRDEKVADTEKPNEAYEEAQWEQYMMVAEEQAGYGSSRGDA